MPTVTWGLGVGESLADFVTSTAIQGSSGSGFFLNGLNSRLLGFSNSNGTMTSPNSPGSIATGFSFQNGSSVVGISSGLNIDVYAFYHTHLLANGIQDAIDYLFGTLGSGGNAYQGSAGVQVFEAFRSGDGFIGAAGNDIFQIGRVSAVTSISYVHGGNSDGTGYVGDTTDTIEFTHAFAGTIGAVTNIDVLKFSAAATPTFEVGTNSFFANNLSLVIGNSLAVSVTLDWTGTGSASFDTSGWTVTGAAFDNLILKASDTANDTITLQDNSALAFAYHLYGRGGDDLLTGSSGSDVIYGGEGDDTVVGGGGYGDFLDGDNGTDVLTYEGELTGDGTEGITVFALGTADSGLVQYYTDAAHTGGLAASHTYAGFELVRGTAAADIFNGYVHADNYAGMGGNDSFSGGAGNDTLDGGAGSDSIDGGADEDTAVFSGHWSDYAIGFSAGTYTLVRSADTDSVTNVEFVTFDDGTLALTTDLINVGPDANDDISGVPLIVEGGNGTTTGDVLSNDTDANLATAGLGEVLTVNGLHVGTSGSFTAVTGPTALKGKYGTLTINADGTYSYALDEADADTQALTTGQTVEDKFTYRVRDAHGATDTAVLTVSVGGTNDLPVITSNGSGAITLKENIAAVTTVTVTDFDNSSRTFALSGADASKFTISTAGALTFKTAPDFDAPADVGKNNIYNVTITVNDGSGGTDVQNLAITVQNLKGNTIAGTTANNTIDLTHKIAGKGATIEEDKIDGKTGNDTINGLAGNDTLIGGSGKDVLTGGAGLDKFVFNAKLNATTNVDTIKDFKHDLDLIQLDDAIFKNIGTRLDAGEFYAKAGATSGHDANDRIIYDKATGKLYYDDDGSGSHTAILFATLTGKPQNLDAGDFGIV